jgi:hypothetical protein
LILKGTFIQKDPHPPQGLVLYSSGGLELTGHFQGLVYCCRMTGFHWGHFIGQEGQGQRERAPPVLGWLEGGGESLWNQSEKEETQGMIKKEQ